MCVKGLQNVNVKSFAFRNFQWTQKKLTPWLPRKSETVRGVIYAPKDLIMLKYLAARKTLNNLDNEHYTLMVVSTETRLLNVKGFLDMKYLVS